MMSTLLDSTSRRSKSPGARLTGLLWLVSAAACGEAGGTRLFITPPDAGNQAETSLPDGGVPDSSTEAGMSDASIGPSDASAGAPGMEEGGSDASDDAPLDDTCEVENTLRCLGQELQSCGVNGMFQTVAKCRDVDYCDEERGQCRACACQEGSFRCEGATLSLCRGCRLGFEVVRECEPPLVCNSMNGTCGA